MPATKLQTKPAVAALADTAQAQASAPATATAPPPVPAPASAKQATSSRPPPTPLSMYALVHALHATIAEAIDTSLTWDQLNAPGINYTLVRPIVERYTPGTDAVVEPADDDDDDEGYGDGAGQTLGAILYALMANRIQFINLAEADLSYAPLQTTRAAFCELLAIKILRTFPNPADESELTSELVRTFGALDGAPESIWSSVDDRREAMAARGSALELAIVSSAKNFLSTPLIQHLNSLIYTGQLIYAPVSSRSLIADSYVSEHRAKQRRRQGGAGSARSPGASALSVPGIEYEDDGVNSVNGDADVDLAEVYAYNPYEAGWLDHQRLRVPRWRKWLEFGCFTILIALFVFTLAARDFGRVTVIEVIFILYACGFILDEFAASKEHGWTVYVANAWNAFDMAFIIIFLLYLTLRIVGLATHSPDTSDLAFDILACGACVLFPRLVFFLIKDNVVVLALREMIFSFVGFMCLTTVAFSGICFCLWTLGRGTWTVKQIIWLMLQIWFGSSYLGFQASSSFHPLFGPIVLISYAALCNTLLITILISILSNKFAAINQNAQQEHLFQRVVGTVEGVKSDAVFSYLPPVNIPALLILVPLGSVVTPRTLHRVNVFFIRVTNFPILFAISAYERYVYRQLHGSVRLGGGVEGGSGGHADHIQRPSMFDTFLGGGSESLIRSAFDIVPPPVVPSTPPKVVVVSSDDEGGSANVADISGSPTTRRSGGAGAAGAGASRDIPSGLDSPLAKLFRANASGGSILSRRRGGSGGGDLGARDGVGAGAGAVLVSAEEWAEVRSSQKRLEEMLGKVLAMSGGT